MFVVFFAFFNRRYRLISVVGGLLPPRTNDLAARPRRWMISDGQSADSRGYDLNGDAMTQPPGRAVNFIE